MKIIKINRINDREAFEVFGPGMVAIYEGREGRPGWIKYDAETKTDKGENWSVCAFGNLIIKLLAAQIGEIYIVSAEKISDATLAELIDAAKNSADFVITTNRYMNEFINEIITAPGLWKIQLILDLAADPLNEIDAGEMAQLRELANKKRQKIGRARGVGLQFPQPKQQALDILMQMR